MHAVNYKGNCLITDCTLRDIICISNITYEDTSFFFFVVASTESQL